MATALPEPTQLLTEIFSAPPETHASSLDRVRKQLEADPGALPKFVAPLISLIGQNELLTGWILNVGVSCASVCGRKDERVHTADGRLPTGLLNPLSLSLAPPAPRAWPLPVDPLHGDQDWT
jgi:hypothetical protein